VSVSLFCQAFRSCGWQQSRLSSPHNIEFRKGLLHAILKWRRNIIDPEPPYFIEVSVHYDYPNHASIPSQRGLPHRTKEVKYGPVLDDAINEVFLKYAVLLWKEARLWRLDERL